VITLKTRTDGRTTERTDNAEADRRLLRTAGVTGGGRDAARAVVVAFVLAPSATGHPACVVLTTAADGWATPADRATGARGLAGRRRGCTRARTFYYENSGGGVRIIYRR